MNKRFKTPAGCKREDFYTRLVFEVPKPMKDEIMSAARSQNTFMSVIVREAIADYLDSLRYGNVG